MCSRVMFKNFSYSFFVIVCIYKLYKKTFLLSNDVRVHSREQEGSVSRLVGSAGASAAGNVVVDLAAWLAGSVPHGKWRRLAAPRDPPQAPPSHRDAHLAHKYLAKWRERVSRQLLLLRSLYTYFRNNHTLYTIYSV